MTPCLFCGGYVPLPETSGEDTYCTGCGRAYQMYEREEVWFNQYWEKYRPAEAKE